uniref:Uncharacterized protein n=1 Tax=Leersia perrieri TaxID=77586 RepID=A0A0D9X9R8_9ORYZ
MIASSFIEYKLDYLKAQELAVGKCLPARISAGDHNATIYCCPSGSTVDNGEYISLLLMLKDDPKINVVFEAFLMGKDGAPSSKHEGRSMQQVTVRNRSYCIIRAINAALLYLSKCDEYLSLDVATKYKSIFEVFLMDRDGQPSNKHAHRSLLVQPAPNSLLCDLWKNFAKCNELIYVSDGVIKFICGLVLVNKDDDPLVMSPSNLGGQISAMWATQTPPISLFFVAGETFHAQKLILSTRSQVFKSQLLV